MQCKGTSKRTGERCRRSPIPGGLVCHFHGGGAPQVRQAAAVNLAEHDARRVWAATDHPPVDNPLEELQLLAGEVVGWKELMRNRIAELQSIGYKGMTSEQIRAEVQLYTSAVDQLGRLLTSIGRLAIDERLAVVSATQAAMVAAAIDAALALVARRLTAGEVVQVKEEVIRQLLAARDGERELD
ncbi:hypothetical protein AB0383_49755 [Amycolatopsis sp. NPDC051373]|uniref:hypothetical protein n=1 Tax=Amycolatopsis sp. NPDC051373 TaxID=3155801 RepID=UPI00344CB65F